MRRRLVVALPVLVAILAAGTLAQGRGSGSGSGARPAAEQTYAGQQSRGVSSLSPREIADLEAGRGWGLAKPAELNGYPGPAHVLELADKLGLSAAQKKDVQAIFERMRERAIAAGKSYIATEAALDLAFKDRSIDAAALAERLSTAETARAALREVHLAAHLATAPLLTEAQRRRYAALRGYAGGKGSGSGSAAH